MSYPGVNQPAWWFSTTATANTTWYPPVYAAPVRPSQAVTPEPQPPASNVEWLREQVGEICGLAFEVC